MKSTSGWNNNGNGTNSSGFSGLPGGGRNDGGAFNGVGDYGYWWSSTEYDTDYAWYRILYNLDGGIARTNFNKKNGFSVRFIKN